VRERALTEARGNPLALRQLPRWIGPTEMAARSTPAGIQVPERLRESARVRLSRLPPAVGTFLLLAGGGAGR
jgi:hypothetical protein